MTPMNKIADRSIISASNKSISIRQLAFNAGFMGAGTHTLKRFKKLLGNSIYREIASGKRNAMPRSKWTKVPSSGTRRSSSRKSH